MVAVFVTGSAFGLSRSVDRCAVGQFFLETSGLLAGLFSLLALVPLLRLALVRCALLSRSRGRCAVLAKHHVVDEIRESAEESHYCLLGNRASRSSQQKVEEVPRTLRKRAPA